MVERQDSACRRPEEQIMVKLSSEPWARMAVILPNSVVAVGGEI